MADHLVGLLPEHRPGTPSELGATLRSLHSLPPPTEFELPSHDPFAGLRQRIGESVRIRGDDKTWLIDRTSRLEDQYRRLEVSRSRRVIHGDAWQGNLAVPEFAPPILIDLEHVSLGHPDWDLIQIAVDHTDFDRITAQEYGAFVTAYGGHDVTGASSFRTIADIQELRWVCFVLGKIGTTGRAGQETQHRIACLRGDISRPWTWTAF